MRVALQSSSPSVKSQPHAPACNPAALIEAAHCLLAHLESGTRLTATHLRNAMTAATGESDAAGAWKWKDATEACELAQVLFVRRHGPAMQRAASSPAAFLAMLTRLVSLIPTHTKRSLESQALQQFSTPLPLAYLVALAADLKPDDIVLEPSAGTGLLAIFAEFAHCRLVLNEVAPQRAALLGGLFPSAPRFQVDAADLDDRLPLDQRPSVILMNPPFSADLHVARPQKGCDLRHLRSAFARLLPGGRLVAILSGAADLTALPASSSLRLAVELDGSFFAPHGTSIATRLVVIDKADAAEPSATPTEAATSYESLLAFILSHQAPRAPCRPPVLSGAPVPSARATTKSGPETSLKTPVSCDESVPCLSYEALTPAQGGSGSRTSLRESLYEPYRIETLRIDGAHPHPTPLVQSVAMASVGLPPPTYRPKLPQRIVSDGLLSDAQLESVLYAGQAHAHHLSGQFRVNESLNGLTPAAADDPSAVRFRRGWFLGDGTGAGKGRQVAGIILDNWHSGRRRAIWISKSDKLIEDAQRDWSALGQEKLRIVPQDRYRPGQRITLDEGILFTTYATLRSAERAGKASRLAQIVQWLGADFDGAIIFDEAHALSNAAASKSSRGDRGPSQQGLAGLRLQHALPNARVVYVSATGATAVEQLAYAQRLGLWGSEDFPFATRSDFVTAMHKGGIAAMEVLARDLKALGLYTARALSYEGVVIDMLDHTLSPEQTAIYDAYASAFQIIHQNLDCALKAAHVTSESQTLNPQAKAAARSAFESNKQRFFNHLITAMKVPSLIKAVQADIDSGHAPVVQLVSTSEALLDRRLAHIPASEWGDLSIDITPREYVLDYLAHGFPTQLYEIYSDEDGGLLSRPAMQDGQPIECREAAALRDCMIEQLAALPPVQSALDQLLQYFGTEIVAEVTGRSRRIVKQKRLNGDVLALQTRPASANIAETQAFMADRKRVLIFSDAGGTGRSYHADLAALNQRQRVHYLLEAGWRADTAIQGLGRTNRTNQKQPPVFRPVTTDIKGERRFLSTIARRLDALGAITRGQRQTGGQGLFRPEDNLESPYARAALLQLYRQITRGQVPCCTLSTFECATGLSLTDESGSMREELPPITQFLNRLLALPITLQNGLFEHLEGLIRAVVEQAIAGGTYEMGLETIRAESLQIVSKRPIARHAASGAETFLLAIERKDRNQPLRLEQALELAQTRGLRLLRNTQSGHAALLLPHSALTLEDGSVQERVRLQRPLSSRSLPLSEFSDSHWMATDEATFSQLWTDELEQIPAYATSRFHVVTGLLLPIWALLPEDHTRVYRFETDEGERIIGRLVPEGALAGLSRESDPTITPGSAISALQAGERLMLPRGLALAQVRVMHASRIELTGFSPSQIPALKALGLIAEIIAWRTRLFVPTGDPALTMPVLERLLAHAAPSSLALAS